MNIYMYMYIVSLPRCRASLHPIIYTSIYPIYLLLHLVLVLAFTRYCHHQYYMVYGINRGGGR